MVHHFLRLMLLAGAAGGVHGQMLVSSGWLAEHVNDGSLVILHVGSQKDYDDGHIPGARLVTLADISVTGPSGLRLELPPVSTLEAAFGKLGVSDGSRVVIYPATESVQSATRVWFTLDYLGAGDRASLLDGGLAGWRREGREVAKVPSSFKPATFTPRARPERVVDAAQVKATSARLIDARATEFYSTSHVWGADNIPYTSLLDGQWRFKSRDELARLLGSRPIVSYCHIGQQATVAYFAARMLGLNAALYDGSFQDWSSRETPDAVYFNGKIITVGTARPAAQALAVKGNRFLAVGTDKDVLAMAGNATKRVDLKGRTVVPGLIESHGHPIGAALSEQDAQVPAMHSIGEIQAWIRKQAAALPAERLIFVPKIYPSRLKERRYPNRHELDAAAPGRAAMCDNGYAGVLNSVLLKRAGIDRNTPQPQNGKIIKDAQGEPTGLILGAPQLLRPFRASRPQTHADRVWAIKAMHKAYNRAGITSVADRAQGMDGWRAYQEVRDKGELTVRTNVTYYMGASGSPEEVENEIRKIPFKTGHGDDWLRVGPLKTTVDGGILIGTAYLREPYGMNTALYGYTDPDYRGVLAVKKENLFTMARVANEVGWQMTSHATGGGALDLLIEAYEAADRVKPIRDRRWQLMHANFPNAQALERAKKLGAIFDSQIAWHHCDGDALKDVFGPERMKHFLPLRSIIDAGLTAVGGSDHMIRFDSREAINPYHPFYGMWMAITRKTTSGAVLNPEQRITREEALRMWTINGAYAMFDEKVKGTIEPGKLADFVVISADYMTCPEDEIRNIEPLETVVDGKVVWRAE